MGIEKKKPDDDNEDEKETLDAEAISNLIDAKLNGALRNALKPEGLIGKTFAKALEPVTALLTKQAEDKAEREKAEQERAEQEKTKTAAGTGAADSEWKKKLDQLQRKFDEESEARKKAETEREAERQTAKREEERAVLASALRKNGVDEARVKAAGALLYLEDKRVVRDADGKIVFKKALKGGDFEDVSVEDGIADWVKSDDGKVFLPAKGAGGSGGNGLKHPPTSGKFTGKMNDEAAGNAILGLVQQGFTTELK